MKNWKLSIPDWKCFTPIRQSLEYVLATEQKIGVSKVKNGQNAWKLTVDSDTPILTRKQNYLLWTYGWRVDI